MIEEIADALVNDHVDLMLENKNLRAEVERLREERDQIIERCETICETIASSHSVNGRQSASWAASECAGAIGSLKEKQDE
jgi:hypothetical protein